MKNNIAIVLPSYNEAENLSILIKKIASVLPSEKIIVVDDSNPLENKKISLIIKRRKNITLLSRKRKEGRGSAVLQGFEKALEDKKVEYILEMDTDLAHDPKEIQRFLNKLKEDNYDLIVGSRYLPGGKIINISKDRTILSRIINKFLRIWLGAKISDFTSGFRLYSRRAIELIVSEKIISKGFITLSETLYKVNNKRMKIGEVPITWNYRIYGKSNVTIKELFISLFFVFYFRIQNIFSKNLYKVFIGALLIFILSFGIRIYTLNQIGRTWDESEYITQGYKMDELLIKGDFANSFFYTTYDHPPLVKYIYGITAHFDGKNENGSFVFNYDYTYSRFLSAFVASISAVLLFLIAYEFAGFFVGIISGIIFSTLPFFVGLSQLVTTESWLMLIFTLCAYLFLKIMQKFSYKKVFALGVFTGLALQIKQSNGLLFPLFGLFYLIWYLKIGKKSSESFWNKRLISIFLVLIISIMIFVVIWPMPYFHLDVINQINQKIWLVKTSPPIVFWGRLILSPVIYFPTMFIITTPLLFTAFSFLGLKYIDNKKNWIYYCLIIWFSFPFIQSFYPWRQNGIRYIIEIYAPFSIIVALGITYLIKKFRLGIKAKFIFLILVIFYGLFVLMQNKPYYLDYFNSLVGGSRGVYEDKYFELGWWGEGLREASYYLKNNAHKDSAIGLYVSPQHTFPTISGFKLTRYDSNAKYDPTAKYDYIVVNYYHVLREGFDDAQIKQDYKLISTVKAGSAAIVYIYSKK